MQRRLLLRSQLATAWRLTIDESYDKQLINSERGLQFWFCTFLRQEFKAAKVNRRLFIEPCVSLVAANASRHPDVVICNSQRVIGIVELKYLPRARPKFKKDLQTLELFAASSGEVKITNDRYLGIIRGSRSYLLAPDAILCWAGVYKGMRLDLRSAISDPLRKRYLQLDALTAVDANATIICD
jgi:hypothetical protein